MYLGQIIYSSMIYNYTLFQNVIVVFVSLTPYKFVFHHVITVCRKVVIVVFWADINHVIMQEETTYIFRLKCVGRNIGCIRQPGF
jgi:hypothetical protein